jgi:hypothetical protein
MYIKEVKNNTVCQISASVQEVRVQAFLITNLDGKSPLLEIVHFTFILKKLWPLDDVKYACDSRLLLTGIFY